jgi:hypothetical protein
VATQALPEGMDRLVLDCLSNDPALRPQTADEVTDRLDALPIAERWDSQRARAWWERHAPDCV